LGGDKKVKFCQLIFEAGLEFFVSQAVFGCWELSANSLVYAVFIKFCHKSGLSEGIKRRECEWRGGMISKIHVLYRAGIFGKLLAGGINGRLQEISG